MRIFNNLDLAFEKFDDTIKNYLERALSGVGIKYSSSSIYSIIFEGIKGVMQNVMFYLEDALNEQNIFTAYRKKSIYALSKISGYEPFYGSPASGNILCTLVLSSGKLKNNTSKITIFNYTKIINTNTNIVYMLNLPTSKYVIDLAKPLFSTEFSIIQGIRAQAQYVSRGLAMETIHVESVELFDTNSIEVYVDGKKWLRVGTLYDMTENGEEYIITVGYDNAFDITFGNNEYGSILVEGQLVNIEYIKHNGIGGNINVLGSEDFIFAEPGYDIYGNSVQLNNYLQLELKNVVSGGVNSDSVEFIRTNIGLNSRSNVLVSDDNFKLFLKRFSFIGQSNVYIDTNSMNVKCIAMRNLTGSISDVSDLYGLDESAFVLTDEQQNMVIQTLYNSKKMFAGVTFNFENPVIRRYAIQCYVKVQDKFSHDTVEANIKTVLLNYFLNNYNDISFISKSNLIKLILDNVSNIEALSLNIISEYNEQAYRDQSYYQYSIVSQNNSISYKKEKFYWTPSITPGLDLFGNIDLNSKLEIPFLGGPITYYYEKTSTGDNLNSITVDPIEIYFQ